MNDGALDVIEPPRGERAVTGRGPHFRPPIFRYEPFCEAVLAVDVDTVVRDQSSPALERFMSDGKQPIRVTIDADKRVAWCGCKESGKKPFCDGTHARLGG
jgi:hypothetical protein